MLLPLDDLGAVQPCERIEYGKFTDSYGTAESMEHDVLGKSDGFPTALLKFCGPRIIGPSLTDNDVLPQWARHGTVLQPVSVDGTIYPVFVRALALSEGRQHRSYQRARFLRGNSRQSPLSLLRTMNSVPIEGYVRPNHLSVIPALPCLDGAPGRLDPVFITTALTYLLAGTPISLVPEVGEERFFEYAESLWQALPSAIRVYLSVGWGVGSSVKGKLALSAGMAQDDTCAVYDVSSTKWSHPKRHSYEQHQLELQLAGGYASVIFCGDVAALRPNDRRLRLVDCILAQQRAPLPPLLLWDDSRVRSVFQSVGRAASDAWRMDTLSTSLAASEWGQIDIKAIRSDLWLASSNEVATKMLIDGLGDRETQRAFAWALGKWLDEDESISALIASAKGSVGDDARRFLQLSKCGPVDVLRDLESQSGQEDSEDCIGEEGLAAAIRRGLIDVTPLAARLHDRLLAKDSPPRPYRAFLSTSFWLLAFSLDRSDRSKSETRVALITRILRREPVLLNCLRELCELERPGPAAQVILADRKSSGFKDIGILVCDRFADLPNNGVDAREAWLSWALEFVVDGTLPLVDIVRKRLTHQSLGTLSATEIKSLASDVANGRIPRSTESDVALAAISQFQRFLPYILQFPAEWGTVANRWPTQYLRLLHIRPVKAEGLPREFRIFSVTSVELLLTIWCDNFREDVKIYDVAGDLIELCRGVDEYHMSTAPTACLCAAVQRHSLDFLRVPSMRVREVERCAQLYAAAHIGDQTRRIGIDASQAWQSAASGEALLLVLLLFTEQDFLPNDGQMVKLSTLREDLRHHSRELQTGRRPWFELATAEFYQLDFSQRPELYPRQSSPLWAAFRGVPLSRQGSLGAALRHFGRTTRERIVLCSKYLDEARSSRDSKDMCRRVLDEFIYPHLEAELNATELAIFVDAVVLQRNTARIQLIAVSDSGNMRVISCRASEGGSTFYIDKDFDTLIKGVVTGIRGMRQTHWWSPTRQ